MQLSELEIPTHKNDSPFDMADIETSSEDYAKRFSGEIGKYFLDLQTKITLDLIRPWPEARVLDVGGGHAQTAVPLVDHGYAVTVTGSSEACRYRLDKLLRPGSFQFRCCQIPLLPFDDKSFDIVLAYRLLPHIESWKRLIAEMCRVCKYSVIIDYPDIRSFNIISKQLFHVKKKIEGNTRPFHCFKRGELLNCFKRNGFTRPIIRPQFLFPMAFHRSLGRVWISKTIEFISKTIGITRLFGSPIILRIIRNESSLDKYTAIGLLNH